jgi:hypothetical protein
MCFCWLIYGIVFEVVFGGACTTHFSAWFLNETFQCVFVGEFRTMFLRLFFVVLAPLIFRCGFSIKFPNVFLLMDFE